MNNFYEPSTLDAMMGNFEFPNTLGMESLVAQANAIRPDLYEREWVNTAALENPANKYGLANAVVTNPVMSYTGPELSMVPRTAGLGVSMAAARANAVRANAGVSNRVARQSMSTVSKPMTYSLQPSVTTSATNVPGQVQVNLNQQHMRFADPEYQRLYALQEARAREALARQGVSYPTAMNHARSGTSY